MFIFFIVEKRLVSVTQSSRRLSKEKIKKWLMDSLVCNQEINAKALNKQTKWKAMKKLSILYKNMKM